MCADDAQKDGRVHIRLHEHRWGVYPSQFLWQLVQKAWAKKNAGRSEQAGHQWVWENFWGGGEVRSSR